MVLGTPTTLTPSAYSLVAAPRVSSPPMAISASTPRPARLSRIRSAPDGPPLPLPANGLVRDVPRIVPPRGRMPRTAWMSRGTVSPSSGPRQPSRKPTNSYPYSCTPLRTTARITAFKPGQSPPPVRTPTLMAPTLVVTGWPGLQVAAGRRLFLGAGGRLGGQAPGQLLLGRLGVHVHALLTGQLLDDAHDLVGDLTQGAGVRGHAVEAGEVERLAVADPGPDPEVRLDLAGRHELERVDHRARNHRDPGVQGQPGHAGLALVQPPVRATGALGVDAQQVPLGQHAQAGSHGPLAGGAAPAVNGYMPQRAEEGPADEALQPLAGEVLGLSQEDHLPAQRERAEEVIGERQVVAGDDRRPLLGHVAGTFRPPGEEDLQRHPEGELSQFVVHAQIFACSARFLTPRGVRSGRPHATMPSTGPFDQGRTMGLLPGAEPFSHQGGATGVLLCHGFTGRPQSPRPWAGFLAEAGLSLSLPLLPGHGTSWQEMNRTTSDDWYATAEEALGALRARCDEVFVMGLSMGGCLALRLAETHGRDVRGLVLVNPSLAPDTKLFMVAPLLKHVIKSMPAIGNDIKKPG